MIKLRVKYEVEVKTKTNPISQILIDKYGDDLLNWPKADIKNRLIICKNCMQEFVSDEVKNNIYNPEHETRVIFVCPNCGEHNAIKKHRLEV